MQLNSTSDNLKQNIWGGANDTGIYFLNFIGDFNIQLGFGTSGLEEEILNQGEVGETSESKWKRQLGHGAYRDKGKRNL